MCVLLVLLFRGGLLHFILFVSPSSAEFLEKLHLFICCCFLVQEWRVLLPCFSSSLLTLFAFASSSPSLVSAFFFCVFTRLKEGKHPFKSLLFGSLPLCFYPCLKREKSELRFLWYFLNKCVRNVQEPQLQGVVPHITIRKTHK